MNDIELRKFQEAMANLCKIKDEYSKALYSMYKSFKDAGFSKTEALTLIIEIVRNPQK